MAYRIRTSVHGHPLPGMDVTTGSAKTAARVLLETIEDRGVENVSLITTGERPLVGPDAQQWAQRILS